MPVGFRRHRKRSYVRFANDGEKAAYAAAFAKTMDTLALLHRRGIRLWPGTDEDIGFTLHRELELYAQASMSPAEVLRIATLESDAYLKRDQEYGSIVRGKRADTTTCFIPPLARLAYRYSDPSKCRMSETTLVPRRPSRSPRAT
jgi:imidazolonepropionase-like amidohydrolase